MKKVILFFAAVIIFAVSVNAQTTFSIAGNVGAVTGDFGKLAVGGDIQADLPATTGLKITLSAGYENFGYESNTGVKTSSGFIPILAGTKFNLSSNLYGHAQLGYSFSTLSGGKGSFTYAPSLGYNLSPNFDVSAKYLGLSNKFGNANAIVARLAYNFGK
jgi:hypothetical protein